MASINPGCDRRLDDAKYSTVISQEVDMELFKQPWIFLAGFVALIALWYWPRSGHQPKPVAANDARLETAVFAGGCFWCVEADFEKVEGVIEVVSGYTGGRTENPTYDEVASQQTGHLESVKVTYDANLVTYDDLLEVFWRMVNPTDSEGQFVDRGESYATAIFVADEQQRSLAKQSKVRLAESGRYDEPVVTPIRDLGEFYVAEDYHQDYYRKKPLKYSHYRYWSGRDQYITTTWGDEKHYVAKSRPDSQELVVEWTDQANPAYIKPSSTVLRQRLTPLQYRVTQREGTERAFQADNIWKEKRNGIYVDVVSGEPLFSSKSKFDSGTGWPSFSSPLVAENIVEKEDRKLLSVRTEVRSKHSDSHLGHVFDDGPRPTGLRYCLNAAALRFIPAEQLADEGYGHFASLFDPSSDVAIQNLREDQVGQR